MHLNIFLNQKNKFSIKGRWMGGFRTPNGKFHIFFIISFYIFPNKLLIVPHSVLSQQMICRWTRLSWLRILLMLVIFQCKQISLSSVPVTQVVNCICLKQRLVKNVCLIIVTCLKYQRVVSRVTVGN